MAAEGHADPGDGSGGEPRGARRHALTSYAAIDAATLAAAKATSRLDHASAARHFGRAVDHAVDGGAPLGVQFELIHALGRAQWRAGDRTAAAAAFERAWQVAEELGDADRRARAAIGGGFTCDFSGDAALVRAHRCRAALQALPEGDSATKARLLAELAASLAVEEDPATAREAATAATAMARRTSDPAAIGYALLAEQFLNQGPARLERRVGEAREILRIAATTGEHPLEVLGRFCLIGALLEAADPALRAEIDAQSAAVRRLREPGYRRHDVWFRCMLALLEGRMTDAEGLAQEGFEAALSASDPDSFAVYGGQVTVARWMHGRYAETVPTLEIMREQEPATPVWNGILAAHWARTGETAAATELLAPLDVGAVPDDRHQLLAISAIGEAAAFLGDRARAGAAYECLRPYADRMVPIAMGVAPWGPVGRQLGLIATALGEVDAALAHYAAGIEAAERIGSAPWVAWTELDVVAAEVRFERTGPGTVARLAHAGELAQATSMPTLVARTAELQAQVGSAAR